MLLLKQERWAEADAALAAFAERHGDDARAEDAAFLRIAAHRKLNDAAGARALAKDYLARYPRGFRAAEARALLSGE
jgi:outer membrane protein assembly factor BamD (BamD/ComL family)